MKQFSLVLVLALVCGGLFSAPRQQPDPLLADLAPSNPLSALEVLRLALYLGGGSAEDLAQAPVRLDALVGEWKAWQKEMNISDQPEAVGERLLEFLHKAALRRYSENKTRLQDILTEGQFNCVSSSLLYLIVGRSLGLDIQAVVTKSHVFCLVKLPTGEVDVETTIRSGWNPGHKKEFHDSFGNVTGFTYVPPGNYRDRKTINERGLLGLLLQNRMAENQRQGRQEDSIGLAFDRRFLEQDTTLAGPTEAWVNYLSFLNGRKAYAQALDLLESALPSLGPAPELQKSGAALVNNQLLVLMDRQDFAGGRAMVENWNGKGILSAENYKTLRETLVHNQLIVYSKTLPWQQALDKVEEAWSQHLLDEAKRAEFLLYIVGNEANRRTSQGGTAALKFLRDLPPEIQALPNIKKTIDVFAYNFAVAVHNQFAALFKRGDRRQARFVVEEGLKLLPGNQILESDLKILDQ